MSDIRIFGYHYEEFVECRRLLREQKVDIDNYIFVVSLNQLTCMDYTKTDNTIFDILYAPVTNILGMTVYIDRPYIKESD